MIIPHLHPHILTPPHFHCFPGSPGTYPGAGCESHVRNEDDADEVEEEDAHIIFIDTVPAAEPGRGGLADPPGREPDDVFSDPPKGERSVAGRVPAAQDVVFYLQEPVQRSAQRVGTVPADADLASPEVTSRGAPGSTALRSAGGRESLSSSLSSSSVLSSRREEDECAEALSEAEAKGRKESSSSSSLSSSSSSASALARGGELGEKNKDPAKKVVAPVDGGGADNGDGLFSPLPGANARNSAQANQARPPCAQSSSTLSPPSSSLRAGQVSDLRGSGKKTLSRGRSLDSAGTAAVDGFGTYPGRSAKSLSSRSLEEATGGSEENLLRGSTPVSPPLCSPSDDLSLSTEGGILCGASRPLTVRGPFGLLINRRNSAPSLLPASSEYSRSRAAVGVAPPCAGASRVISPFREEARVPSLSGGAVAEAEREQQGGEGGSGKDSGLRSSPRNCPVSNYPEGSLRQSHCPSGVSGGGGGGSGGGGVGGGGGVTADASAPCSDRVTVRPAVVLQSPENERRSSSSSSSSPSAGSLGSQLFVEPHFSREEREPTPIPPHPFSAPPSVPPHAVARGGESSSGTVITVSPPPSCSSSSSSSSSSFSGDGQGSQLRVEPHFSREEREPTPIPGEPFLDSRARLGGSFLLHAHGGTPGYLGGPPQGGWGVPRVAPPPSLSPSLRRSSPWGETRIGSGQDEPVSVAPKPVLAASTTPVPALVPHSFKESLITTETGSSTPGCTQMSVPTMDESSSEESSDTLYTAVVKVKLGKEDVRPEVVSVWPDAKHTPSESSDKATASPQEPLQASIASFSHTGPPLPGKSYDSCTQPSHARPHQGSLKANPLFFRNVGSPSNTLESSAGTSQAHPSCPEAGGIDALYFSPDKHELIHVKRLNPDPSPSPPPPPLRSRSALLDRDRKSPSPKLGESEQRGRKRGLKSPTEPQQSQRPRSATDVYSNISTDPERDLVWQYLRELWFLICLLTCMGLVFSIRPHYFVGLVLGVHLTLFFSRKYIFVRK